MKLKYEFAVNGVANQYIAIAVGEGHKELRCFFRMNDVGVAIFSKLKTEISKDELIRQMTLEYPDETNEAVIAAVEEFLEILKNENLICI